MNNREWTVYFALLRSVMAARFFWGSPSVAWCFSASEILAALMSLHVLSKATSVDRSASAKLVPVLYLAPLLLTPSGNGPLLAGTAVMLLAFLQIGLRLAMGRSLTVGTPSLVQVLSGGPYALCRHPLAACELAICVLFVVRFPCLWNFLAGWLAVVSCILAVFIEERFLFRNLEYRRYAEKVTRRFLPA